MKSTPLPRLAVVLSHPIQYYSPWFRWIRNNIELPFKVFYLWEFGVAPVFDPQFGAKFKWDVDLLDGYDSEFVPNTAKDPGAHHFWGFKNPLLTSRMRNWNPDAVLLFGYNWASHLQVAIWARLKGIPVVFRGDSHFLGRPPPRFLKGMALRMLYRQFSAVTYVGRANRAYFEALGVPPERLFFAPHAVDSTLFDPTLDKHRSAAEKLRRDLGLDSATRVVLFAGKLVAAKQPRELLQVFASKPRPGWALVFVGDGEEASALKQDIALLAKHSHGPQVRFLPFANQSEMPSRYMLADLFALPSKGHYETWGLAVNEAMHMGVPCLVSDLVGCQADLVVAGETGWCVRADDSEDLGRGLESALAVLSDPESRERYRQAAIAKVANYSYEEATSGLLSALGNIKVRVRR